jgi:PAS domain S-box-containing protein
MVGNEPGKSRVRDVLIGVLMVQMVFALTAGAALILDPAGILDHPVTRVLAAPFILTPIVVACLLVLRFHRCHVLERRRARGDARLMDTVLATSHEWVWAVDDEGVFTFSSPASAGLLGFLPSELVGRHCSLVINPKDLGRARGDVESFRQVGAGGWSGILVRCRHRNGNSVWMDVSGTARLPQDGQRGGFEGTSRSVPHETAQEAMAAHRSARITEIIDGRLLLTAFQPIRGLACGEVIGVEALSRFVSDDGAGPEHWFNEADALGLAAELDIAALQSALAAAKQLPPHIYVALNMSPGTCLDWRLPAILEASCVPLRRIVLELTERLEVSEYGPLIAALAPLRARGLRIAVDDAGSGFASMRHVLHLRPDIIKLDRSLISGINDDQGQRALGAAMVEFARQIGATVVAEGIESPADLVAVTGIGMTAGQGYLLGRPSVHPRDWAEWHSASRPIQSPAES